MLVVGCISLSLGEGVYPPGPEEISESALHDALRGAPALLPSAIPRTKLAYAFWQERGSSYHAVQEIFPCYV